MEQDQVEVWQNTTEGGVWVQVKDKRNGGWDLKRVNGTNSPGNKIQLTADERTFNQEQIPPHNTHLDPFTNSQLVCIQGRPAGERGRYELTDDDLLKMLQIGDDEIFDEAIGDIGIELPLRRLATLAEKHAPLERYNKIRTLIDARYRVGGTQRSVEEMIAAAGEDRVHG